MGELPQAERDYQLSRPNEFACPGMNAFTIAGMVIISSAVGLRFLARKAAKLEWKADDYTLLVGLILTLGAQSLSVSNVYNAHSCYHSLTMTRADFELQGKQWYAWNVLYTTSYPISRISLVLLYRRVFIKTWFRGICWFLIFCFAGYSIGSMVADFCQVLPVEANWNPDVKPTSVIHTKDLYLGNTGFNIATDAILLVLPLSIVWTLRMTWLHKLGLTAVFCLGGLTVVASIFRLVCYLTYNVLDPNYGLAKSQWWTLAEMDLGILCPCLVTFGPVIKIAYGALSSQLSPRTRERADRITGVSSEPRTLKTKSEIDHSGSSTNVNDNSSSRSHSLEPKAMNLEGGRYGVEDGAPAMPRTSAVNALPRDTSGMAINQDIAVANLDPRIQAKDLGHGRTKRMGTSTQAMAGEERSAEAPVQGIGVSRDWRLESE